MYMGNIEILGACRLRSLPFPGEARNTNCMHACNSRLEL